MFIVISIDDEPDTLVARPLKYGDCPVCKRRMKMEELTEHAMGCQVVLENYLSRILYGS